jgi:methyl-accepting chemotaxis protein WspA
MKLNLKRKVLGLAFLAATLPILVMLLLTSQFERTVAQQAEEELNQIADQSVKQIAKDVYAMCETSHELLLRKANVDLNIAQKLLQEAGGAQLSDETVSWTARNQRTGEAVNVHVPKLLIGGRWPGQSSDLAEATPVVDETHRLVGAWCSILQRSGDQGDLLRAATSVEVQNKRRAIGTLIPAVDQDGKPNAAASAAGEGRSFAGLANVAGRWLVAAYQPIKDRQGKVIGMFEVVEKPDSMETLRKAMLKIRVGKTGYVGVVGGHGDLRGRYIISRDGKRDGEDIWMTRDSEGRFFLQEQFARAMKQPTGEVTLERYTWQNPDEAAPRAKIASLVYFPPWDWIISVGTYQDDYYATRARIHEITRALLLKLILAGAALLAGAVGLAAFLSERATRPLGVTIGVANKIASGDLSQARSQLTASQQPVRAKPARFFQDADETVELLGAFDTMTGSLDSLIGQVQRSGIQVTTSATQIASSARELEAAVAEQAASTREVTTRSRDISKTAEDLSKLMSDVGEQLGATASTAEARRDDLSKMEAAMRQLMKATGQITSKLGTINERANRISSVITTINKISDQTNLLSLNAAIEAEKAGEFGKGFAVVAREISRLADQTAVATQDIEYVVREMQSSVASGVMEMDRFAEQVRKGVGEVAGVGDELTRIIDQVRNLGPEFGTVEQWMQNQSQGAEQISESMVQLSQAAEQTKESLHEFKQATEQLNQAVQGLQNEVSRFKISA